MLRAMTLSPDDRSAIAELISLHGHVFDDGDLDRLDVLFTPSVVYDVSELGGGALHGIEAIRTAALALGEHNPLGHHVTNIVITEHGDGTARVRSKGIGVNTDGTVGTVTYEDGVVATEAGWRIDHRRVVPRRVPLNGRRA
ncbi:SnoaL-like protein [Pseudonocardia cypriaca]|uniref:SnoaL-like protein n=2 Tax=Pseudonocardia cypriaca TaxID=882449 RepID=A0A543GFG5_9PSEU|nr:SnoaL-like protein [Pseudonocardia cypriaca]